MLPLTLSYHRTLIKFLFTGRLSLLFLATISWPIPRLSILDRRHPKTDAVGRASQRESVPPTFPVGTASTFEKPR